MKVLIVTSVDENEKDLHIVMVTSRKSSPIVTLEGMVDQRRGNPYLVYGDVVEAFTGCDKFATTISVAECVSGDLLGWEG